MTSPAQSSLPTSGHSHVASVVPAATEYHRVLAGDKRRVGRGILAIALLVAGIYVFPVVIGLFTGLIDRQFGYTTAILGGKDYTLLYYAGSMISLALLIPWSMLIQHWLYRVPKVSLHSVTSRFRFDVFGKALLVFGPVWLLANTAGLFAPISEVPWSRFDLVGFTVATLLLVPLQAAGEEYGVRGLIFRVIGSWTRSPRAGLIAGVVASSILFTAIHNATDLYIAIWYLVWWSCLAIITWRTGGLEIAIVLHAVANTFILLAAILLRSDLAADLGGGDRSAGVGSPTLLIPTAVVIVITAVIWFWTLKTGPSLTPPRTAQTR